MVSSLLNLAADVAVKTHSMRELEQQLDWQSYRYLLCRTNEEDFNQWKINAKIAELEMKMNNGDIHDIYEDMTGYHTDIIVIEYVDGSREVYKESEAIYQKLFNFYYNTFQDWVQEQFQPILGEALIFVDRLREANRKDALRMEHEEDDQQYGLFRITIEDEDIVVNQIEDDILYTQCYVFFRDIGSL